MLSWWQRAELDLERFRHQDQLLPPSFLARVTRIHDRAPTAFGEAYLYTVFDVVPVDSDLKPIASLELKAVQCAISVYQPVPDLLRSPVEGSRELRVTSEDLNLNVADARTGSVHVHSSVNLLHSHTVFTEELDDWRALFYTGDDDPSRYLAIVNSVAAGENIYYFVVGFVLSEQVGQEPGPAPFTEVPPLIIPDDTILEYTWPSLRLISIDGAGPQQNEFTYEEFEVTTSDGQVIRDWLVISQLVDTQLVRELELGTFTPFFLRITNPGGTIVLQGEARRSSPHPTYHYGLINVDGIDFDPAEFQLELGQTRPGYQFYVSRTTLPSGG